MSALWLLKQGEQFMADERLHCPDCGSINTYYRKTYDDWRCKNCKNQFPSDNSDQKVEMRNIQGEILENTSAYLDPFPDIGMERTMDSTADWSAIARVVSPTPSEYPKVSQYAQITMDLVDWFAPITENLADMCVGKTGNPKYDLKWFTPVIFRHHKQIRKFSDPEWAEWMKYFFHRAIGTGLAFHLLIMRLSLSPDRIWPEPETVSSLQEINYMWFNHTTPGKKFTKPIYCGYDRKLRNIVVSDSLLLIDDKYSWGVNIKGSFRRWQLQNTTSKLFDLGLKLGLVYDVQIFEKEYAD